MKLEIDFPESIAADIVREARKRGMEPEHWVLSFVMEKMLEAQQPRRSRTEFDAAVAYVLEKNAPAMEALGRSEREDAAMAPEELALKYPNRRWLRLHVAYNPRYPMVY